MGWWSTDIMGGDTPLDFKSDIYNKLKLDPFKSTRSKIKKVFDEMDEKTINSLIPSTVTRWGCGEPGSDFHNDMTSIGYQVLAIEMMRCGAKIRPTTFKQMEEWIPLDGWSQDDDERNTKVNILLKTLYSYDGSPIEIKSQGLMDVFAEHLSKSNPGLINKNTDGKRNTNNN